MAALAGLACPAPGPPPRCSASLASSRSRGAALPLELQVLPAAPLRPAPLFAFGGELFQLRFHLNLRNRGERALELRALSLRARRAGAAIAEVELGAALLARRLRAAPVVLVRDRQSLAIAARGRALLRRAKGDTRIGPGESLSLLHELSLLRRDELPDELELRVLGDAGEAELRVPVREHVQRTRLALPVSGRWWVMAAHRLGEDHAEDAVASQLYSYDLGVLGAELASYRGDPRRNASYLAWDRPILAAADGEVVTVHDGVAENEPVGMRPSWRDAQRRPEDLAGNFVVLRHEAGEHTAYLHLRPGLALRVGARVRRGEPVGRCGNSGNSRESHLHIQLQDGPDPLRAAALPPRFGDFTLLSGGLKLYVPPDRPQPLPAGHPIAAGRLEGAVLFAP